nr:hypothetical protein [Gordonia sp. LAM0048]
MIDAATAARRAADWIGACAAAGFDADIDLDAVRRRCGADLAEHLQDDLLHLAPDLLRWHLPRMGPAGHLRPGLTIALARYGHGPGNRFGTAGSVYLVARTAPRWADAGQRVSLTLWDGSTPVPPSTPPAGPQIPAGPASSSVGRPPHRRTPNALRCFLITVTADPVPAA